MLRPLSCSPSQGLSTLHFDARCFPRRRQQRTTGSGWLPDRTRTGDDELPIEPSQPSSHPRPSGASGPNVASTEGQSHLIAADRSHAWTLM